MKNSQYIKLSESTYTGGKDGAGIIHKLVNQMPPHQTYVCGFLGHDAIMRHKLPAKKNIGFELSNKTLQTWSKAKFPTDKINWNNLELHQEDFIEFLNPFEALFQELTTYLYLDPPYPIQSRMGKKKMYKHELTDKQHYDLLQKVKLCGCNVGINTYPNELYEKELKDWRMIEYKTTTRGRSTIERFYMNYDEPVELHDYSFIGENKRQREAIKRRFNTFKKRLEEMDIQERLMYVEYVKEQYELNQRTNTKIHTPRFIHQDKSNKPA